MTDSILLSRGQPYPLQYPRQDCAVADFLRKSGNRLLIVLSGMSSAEERAFRQNMIKGGFLYQEGALLWLFRFYGKDGNPLFTFDAPFDARLIPRDELQLHSIDNAEQRLVIDLHAVDDRGILRAIRAITLSPGLTVSFLSAVQDQLATASGQRQWAAWMQKQPNDLAKTITLEVLGK